MIKIYNLKRYFQFALIVLAGGAIYPLIYLRTSYQETILEVYGLSLPALNGILSVLGVAFVIGYFPSGWMADRFSAKKLLSISMLFVGLAGLWFAQVPSYPSIIIIFSIWGVFSVLTFWSAHLKLVTLLAKKGEEGRFFGILDGGKGIIEAILASIAAGIFAFVLKGSSALSDKHDAFTSVVYMYSIICLIVALLVLIFVNVDNSTEIAKIKENKENNKKNKKGLDLSAIKKIVSNQLILLLGGIIFTAYIVAQIVYYIGGYLETNIGISASVVATITVGMLWMRPIGAIGGGILGDRFGKRFIFIVSLAITAIALTMMALLSTELSPYIFYALTGIVGLSVYSIRGLYWSLLGDLNIDDDELGLSIGVISFIGYMPDIILPLIVSLIMTSFGDNGYGAYLIFTALLSLVSIGFIVIMGNKLKKQKLTS